MKCSDCKLLIKLDDGILYCKYHRSFISPNILKIDVYCPSEEENHG
uniref:Uncharacterized protein n=1 Tax=viral metagenome TaxID=1070528 RepID=A0A6M3XS84_9ZZZZ